MTTLSQVGRGAVLLTSIALVACYIDVYTTGKFPWQHAAAEETPATTESVETWSARAQHTMHLCSAAAVLTAIYPEMRDYQMTDIEIFFAMSGGKSDVHGNRVVAQALYGTVNGNSSEAEQAQHTVPIFLPGSKSDVAAGIIVVQPPTVNAPSNSPTNAPATLLFLSGTKSFSGQTTVLSGALNPAPPANSQTEQKAPVFIGGSKSLMLPTRLPETAQPRVVTPTQSPQFMGGAKSPGPLVRPNAASHAPAYIPPPSPVIFPSGDKLQGYPTTTPAQGTAPKPSSASSSTNPLFMSGAKSPIREVPKDLFTEKVPTQRQTAPNALQTAPPAPLQITPKDAPNLPAPAQQAAPRLYGDKLGSPAGSY